MRPAGAAVLRRPDGLLAAWRGVVYGIQRLSTVAEEEQIRLAPSAVEVRCNSDCPLNLGASSESVLEARGVADGES